MDYNTFEDFKSAFERGEAAVEIPAFTDPMTFAHLPLLNSTSMTLAQFYSLRGQSRPAKITLYGGFFTDKAIWKQAISIDTAIYLYEINDEYSLKDVLNL